MIANLPMAHVAERGATHYLHAFQGTEVATCHDGLVHDDAWPVDSDLATATMKVRRDRVLAKDAARIDTLSASASLTEA